MPKRRLVCIAEDDGTTVNITIDRYQEIGGWPVGPHPVFEGSVLSFPEPTDEDWMRSMAVLFVERL